ncbi:CopG family transcriptional regulator [Aetokthonos hydrillicola Thurmond2011]|jgi:predicted DNA-binding protein|uniref:CopG family transcriptional regulator n=1 Tax=Aetokthonos hydrillicola Thurmond2011 TaxID=2712845 RepID=A0AAP5MCZ3_9CYAN|nr:CopG family transcriptional regulator [Aetokthonos hydrillicola]MBO3462059.1 CopG family transcriptional regulator [Aetokthonos hydrillicola CCALA 1050]MBW4585572.1 CopG family transcriptional regulator [Aetokthonos hydrillicola CCALA 1050]MDR9900815.1 CopG family transcriptional regulator [Aetokthonos hydrillicola Thurmond2011]
MKRLSVRFSDKEYEDLVKLSHQTERSLNDLVRESTRQLVQDWLVKTSR